MVQAAWQRHFPLDWLREINAQVSTLKWIKLRTATTHTHTHLSRLTPQLSYSHHSDHLPQPLLLYIVCTYCSSMLPSQCFPLVIQIAISVTRSGLSL